MARILNEEEEDEFYATTYGGFKDTEGDDDYRYNIQAMYEL
jgi:vacuolar protein sorting-associated protein 72